MSSNWLWCNFFWMQQKGLWCLVQVGKSGSEHVAGLRNQMLRAKQLTRYVNPSTDGCERTLFMALWNLQEFGEPCGMENRACVHLSQHKILLWQDFEYTMKPRFLLRSWYVLLLGWFPEVHREIQETNLIFLDIGRIYCKYPGDIICQVGHDWNSVIFCVGLRMAGQLGLEVGVATTFSCQNLAGRVALRYFDAEFQVVSSKWNTKRNNQKHIFHSLHQFSLARVCKSLRWTVSHVVRFERPCVRRDKQDLTWSYTRINLVPTWYQLGTSSRQQSDLMIPPLVQAGDNKGTGSSTLDPGDKPMPQEGGESLLLKWEEDFAQTSESCDSNKLKIDKVHTTRVACYISWPSLDGGKHVWSECYTVHSMWEECFEFESLAVFRSCPDSWWSISAIFDNW